MTESNTIKMVTASMDALISVSSISETKEVAWEKVEKNFDVVFHTELSRVLHREVSHL